MTKKIGLEPTTSWKKGDLHPKTRLERKLNRWMLYTRLSKNEDLENHIKDVLGQLDSRKDTVVSVCAEFNAYIQLVGYFYLYYPGFHLDREDTARLGAYRLSLDCDFYYLFSDKREATE